MHLHSAFRFSGFNFNGPNYDTTYRLDQRSLQRFHIIVFMLPMCLDYHEHVHSLTLYLILLPAHNENNESPDPTVDGHRRAQPRSLHALSRATKRTSRLVLRTMTTDL